MLSPEMFWNDTLFSLLSAQFICASKGNFVKQLLGPTDSYKNPTGAYWEVATVERNAMLKKMLLIKRLVAGSFWESFHKNPSAFVRCGMEGDKR